MPILKRFFWESNFRKFPLFRFRSIGLDVHAGDGAAAGVVEVLEGRIPFQGDGIFLPLAPIRYRDGYPDRNRIYHDEYLVHIKSESEALILS